MITTTAAGHDPGAFIRGVGEAYRASGRSSPLFDTTGHNPYPLHPSEPPTARHAVYIGQGDYERLVTVLDEAFYGTPQPATPIWYLENGFQTTVARTRRARYAGRETSSRTVSPGGQAAQLVAALRLASCQPSVAAYFNFLLVDEPSLERWQSGLLWADWKRKPAFDAYRSVIDEIRRGAVDCAGRVPFAGPSAAQQIRGSGSPTSMSTIRLPPRRGVEEHEASRLRLHRADDRGLGAERVRAQERERLVGGLRRDDGDQLALVRDVERVDAEDLAGSDDGRAQRQRALLERDADARLLRPAR